MQKGGSDDEHGAGERRRVKWGREGGRVEGGRRRDPGAAKNRTGAKQENECVKEK